MPFEEKQMNINEIINESTILLTSYLLLILMNVDSRFDISNIVGYIMISIFMANFLVNVILILLDKLHLLKLLIKKLVKKLKD